MTKDNVVIGARLTLDTEDKKVFITMDDEAHVIEGDVVNSKITFNVPRGVTYTALFSGKVELKLENYPCYLVEQSKIQEMVDSMGAKTPDAKPEITLFNQQTDGKEDEVKNKNKDKSAFDVGMYEAARLAGSKLRPDASLSKKQQKHWHTARRTYETEKGYMSMYPSEKEKDKQPVQPIAPETAQQPTKEPKEQVLTAKETAEVERLAAAYGVDKKDVELIKPKEEEHKKIDIGKEYASLEEKEIAETEVTEDFNVGDGNKIGTFGDIWDGFCIAYFHKADSLYTITATKPHPTNGFRYYLAFPNDRGAKFVRDLLLKHGNINEQVRDSKIYKISEILQEDLKEIPCVIVAEGLSYLSSKALDQVEEV